MKKIRLLLILIIALLSSCDRNSRDEVITNGITNNNLTTSNTPDSDVDNWLIPLLSEYLKDEDVASQPPSPAETETQYVAVNERLSITTTTSLTSKPNLYASNGFIASYVSHLGTEVIFDLQVTNNSLLTDSDVLVEVFDSSGNVIGKQDYLVTSTFANSQVVVSLKNLSIYAFNDAIADLGYTVSVYDELSNKASVDIGQHSSVEALKTLYTVIANTSSSTQLQTQGLASSIRVLAGPNYAYKPTGHRSSFNILRSSCDVKHDLEAYASSWDPITDLVNLTGASQAHEAGFFGEDIVVVLLDSSTDNQDSFDCPDANQPDGHGTHIRDMVKALAPNVTLESKQVFSSDTNASIDNFINTSDLLKALKEIEQDYLLQGKKVILNMSFSTPAHPEHGPDLMLWGTLAELYDLYGEQLLVLTSAGNHGLDQVYREDIFYPAGYSRSFTSIQESFVLEVPSIPNVVSIASVGMQNSQLRTADFNPNNEVVDFLAFGVNLCALKNTICDETLNGSSFATPIVSSIAALIWQQCSQLTSQELIPLLQARSNGIDTINPKVINGQISTDCSGTPIQSNRAPIADAGNDFVIPLGEQAILDGLNEHNLTRGSSDPDGDEISFNWSIVSQPPTSTATLDSNFRSKISFTPDVFGEYIIGLKVNDGLVVSEVDTVSVRIGTVLSGILNEDTTLTIENSPYLIKDKVQIAYGVTMTVSSGVEMFSNNQQYIPLNEQDSIEVFGNLTIRGELGVPVILNNINIIKSGYNPEESSYIDINFARINSGVLSDQSSGSGSVIIRDSVLKELEQVIYIYYPKSDCYIERNIFLSSSAISVGHSEGVNVFIKNNVFYNYRSSHYFTKIAIDNWASYGDSRTIVKNNSFLDVGFQSVGLPAGGYDSAAMIAKENYWGTTEISQINDMIFDKYDDLSVNGYIDYLPILKEPHSDTPDPSSYLNE